jgi:2,4-dienoyl-CoA reductase-like NADH-dependent reductase (Old Yellow Enzyme family)
VGPHVLATLARGPLVARLDDQRRSTRGAIHRSAILARFHGQHFYPQWVAEALAASDARNLRNSRHCRELSQSRERARAAGFDGVELHAANGYLPDQFLQDGSNKRTDGYGGSIENRTRFLMEVVEALASVWGGNRVAVRIGPGGTWNHMSDSNSDQLFDYVAGQLNRFGLAYLHIIEPRVKGNVVVAQGQGPIATQRLRRIFKGRIVAAGGFEPDTAEAIVEKGDADAVAFGRHFLANPDLPKRIKLGLPLNDYDRKTFYTFDSHGYTDYPFAERQRDGSLSDPICQQLRDCA